MLKLVMFLCVVQLGASTMDMDDRDFAQKLAHWTPCDEQGELAKREYEQLKTSLSKCTMLMDQLADRRTAAAVEKAKIKQEKESPEKEQKLKEAEDKVMLLKRIAEMEQVVYQMAVARKELAQKSLQAIFPS